MDNYSVFDARQTLSERITSNAVTLSFFALCAWLSNGSTWWTFLLGSFFIFYVFVAACSMQKKRLNRFKTKAELQAWVDSLD